MTLTHRIRLMLLTALLVGGGLQFGERLAIPGVRGPVSTIEAAALALRHLETRPDAADALMRELDRIVAAARRPARRDPGA